MTEELVYEIASYGGAGDDARLLERVQLASVEDNHILRAAGSDTVCDGTGAVAVVSGDPSLNETQPGAELRISCAPESAIRPSRLGLGADRT